MKPSKSSEQSVPPLNKAWNGFKTLEVGKKKNLKSSAFSRSLQLFGLASAVVGKEIKQTVREKFQSGIQTVASGRLKSRLEQAQLITENLSQLKGAAMKAGQLLSLDAADYFPPEAIEILSKLQASADPAEFDEVKGVLIAELGRERLARVDSIDETPAAAASIGQVHRARFNGRDIALKVQYPGVRESIDSDLALLEKLASGLLTLTGKKMELHELFEELGTVLRAEADYENERRHLEEYGRLLVGDGDYVVPRSVPELCSSRVLAMSWEDGARVTDWLKTNPSGAARERLGRFVLDLYCKEFWDWGFVQTDPNYGNFLVREDPLRLVVLDFGATLRYPIEFRATYKRLLEAVGERDRARAGSVVAEMGILDPRESGESKELFFELLVNAMEPFHPRRQPFRFNDQDYAKRTRDIGRKFTSTLKHSPPPRQILFLHRKLGGVFTLLKRLEVQMDLLPYWDRMIGTTIHRDCRN